MYLIRYELGIPQTTDVICLIGIVAIFVIMEVIEILQIFDFIAFT